MTLQNMLKHPLYAGAYAYGRRQVDPRKQQPGRPSTGRVTRPRHAYHAFLKEHVPAYITWAQYEQHLARLEANRARAETLGSVRHGPSLWLAYWCVADATAVCRCGMGGHASCIATPVIAWRPTMGGTIASISLEHRSMRSSVSGCSPREPAALTLSLEATTRLEQERQELDRLWQQRLERAAYESERAARHYRLVEPEHRLVARQLAKEWKDKLTAQRQLQEEYERFGQAQPRLLSAVAGGHRAARVQHSGPWHAPDDNGGAERDCPADHPTGDGGRRREANVFSHH